MKNYLLPGVLLCFLFQASPAIGQSVPPKLDSVLNFTLDSMRMLWNCTSLSAAIQLPNNAVWSGASGISSDIPRVEVDPAFVYGIGSVTKTFTAACVLQMVDEGKIKLEDSLHQWLDTFPFVNPNITISQLLRHESGLYDVVTSPSFQPQMWANRQQIWQLDAVIRFFIRAPLFQPGARHSYSNTNYILLGMLIEAATGKTYYQEFRERFIQPLGLNSFSMLPFETVAPNVAHVWLDQTGDGILDDSHDIFFGWDSFDSAAGPAGSYYATPADLTKWMRAFLTGTFHTAATLDLAKTTVATGFPAGTRYGLGLMERKFLNWTAFGHGGDFGYAASSFYFPDKDISITVATNDSRRNSWALASIISALLRTYIGCEALVTSTKNSLTENTQPVLFPNPFTDEIQVSFGSPESNRVEKMVLFDTRGRKLAEIETNPNQHSIKMIGLENLPQGVYFLTGFEGNQRLFTNKVVK